jgi:hypothetical protein
LKIEKDFCLFIPQGDIILLAIVSEEIDLINIFHILYYFLQIARNAFQGVLDSEIVKNNYTNFIKVYRNINNNSS